MVCVSKLTLFLGKIAYANAFARPARGMSGVLVITPTRGVIDAATPIELDDLREFAEVNIDENDPRYRLPLERDALKLAMQLKNRGDAVLLGSLATGKYVGVLLKILGINPQNLSQYFQLPVIWLGAAIFP